MAERRAAEVRECYFRRCRFAIEYHRTEVEAALDCRADRSSGVAESLVGGTRVAGIRMVAELTETALAFLEDLPGLYSEDLAC